MNRTRILTKNGKWIYPIRIRNFENLEIGKKYFVVCGIWCANAIYCGHVINKKEYTFTFGNSVNEWKNNFNISSCKSNIEVFEEIKE